MCEKHARLSNLDDETCARKCYFLAQYCSEDQINSVVYLLVNFVDVVYPHSNKILRNL